MSIEVGKKYVFNNGENDSDPWNGRIVVAGEQDLLTGLIAINLDDEPGEFGLAFYEELTEVQA